MNEANLVEDITEPQDPLEGSNNPPSSPREDRTNTIMGVSTTPGGSWAKRVKQSRVSSFALSPDSSSNGSQDILEPVPNAKGRKSQTYHIEKEVER